MNNPPRKWPHRDISQRKMTEEQLHRSSNFYLHIFDEFPAMIWQTDANGHCDYFNKFWLSFTGRSAQQELGLGWLQGVHPEDRERVMSVFQEAFRLRQPYDMDYRLRYRSNNYRWVASTGWPFYNTAGDFAGFLTSSRDISDRKKAVEERIAILSRASRAEAATWTARWPSRNTGPASMRRCKRPWGMQSSSSVSSLTMPPSGIFI